MILCDFSSIMHRMIAGATKDIQPQFDGKFKTEDFIFFAKHLIIQELHNIHQEHKLKFGNLVICLDNAQGGYWRKDVYSRYKESRKTLREESNIRWDEVNAYINSMLEVLANYLPWKVISVPRAEADDIMLVLARHYHTFEPVLIYSPDKDMIQAQHNSFNVHQYSITTKKWIYPENKNESMDEWLLEHICLGDTSDSVPRIIDETVFSENFKKHLSSLNYDIDNPIDFNLLDSDEQENIISNYKVYKTNRKGEPTELDIYHKDRFGPSNLKKKINEFGSLDNFLDSHPKYRENYNRNYKLVMEDGIPSDIWNNIVLAYKEANEELDRNKFEEFLDNNYLSSLKLTINFEFSRELTAEDFGW